ncbi:DUF3784 domain-containing protein [Neobacillus niacini]|uniref:DUF3784 domain-containing protein n=1 Tax=Neobacillus niacini TaxID=86668 RepID=UPI0021CB21CE|nr:DUF3784 domain-containing protein [Neobacillus niacini]MCM3766796.1 DUF3784 domain-containing protein [Neobacillus niacini]
MTLLLVQLGMILMFLLLGWAMLQREAYWLISGFSTRPKEEQEELIANGFPQRTGKLMIATAVGMVLLMPLYWTSFAYTFEVQFGFMMVFLMGGLIYLSKYEVPKKRKRSYIISTSLFVVVIGALGVLEYIAYQDYELIARGQSFEITGVYGDEWPYQEVTKVELLDEMPEVTLKQDGFGMSTIAKGRFKVKDYGSCLLFIRKETSPILYIEMGKKKIFINAKTSEQTLEWYEELKTKTED